MNRTSIHKREAKKLSITTLSRAEKDFSKALAEQVLEHVSTTEVARFRGGDGSIDERGFLQSKSLRGIVKRMIGTAACPLPVSFSSNAALLMRIGRSVLRRLSHCPVAAWKPLDVKWEFLKCFGNEHGRALAFRVDQEKVLILLISDKQNVAISCDEIASLRCLILEENTLLSGRVKFVMGVPISTRHCRDKEVEA